MLTTILLCLAGFVIGGLALCGAFCFLLMALIYIKDLRGDDSAVPRAHHIKFINDL